MVLALFGVSNGAIQFMTYEELKRWRVERRRNRLGGGVSEEEAKKLVRSLVLPLCTLELMQWTVEYGIHPHVGVSKTGIDRDHLPLPGHSFADTSSSLVASLLPIADQQTRSTNPLRYHLIPQYPTASPERTRLKDSSGSTKVSRRTP